MSEKILVICSTEGCNNKAIRGLRAKTCSPCYLLGKYGVEGKARYKKNVKYKTSFGISLEEAQELKASQLNLCALCTEPLGEDSSKIDGWVVDHCHISGKVRGILHRRCNVILGFLQDSPELAVKAAEYLTKQKAHSEEQAQVSATSLSNH